MTYRTWCHGKGLSATRIKIPQLADFFLYLKESKGLGISALKGYRSAISSVLRHSGVDLMASTELRDLFRSFEIEQMSRPVRSYAWNLDVVLTYLMGPPFEPLQDCSLVNLTKKSLSIGSGFCQES